MARTIAVTLTPDDGDSGWWVVKAPEFDGCMTQARTIKQAEDRIRDALSLYLPQREVARVELDLHFDIDAEVSEQLQALRVRAEIINNLSEEADRAREKVINKLKKLGVSVRDIGRVVGVSGARVSQLTPNRRNKTRGRASVSVAKSVTRSGSKRRVASKKIRTRR